MSKNPPSGIVRVPENPLEQWLPHLNGKRRVHEAPSVFPLVRVEDEIGTLAMFDCPEHCH